LYPVHLSLLLENYAVDKERRRWK